MSHRIYTKEEREQIKNEIINKCRIDPGEKFSLADHQTRWAGPEKIKTLGEGKIKKRAKKLVKKNLLAMSEAQELLYASNQYSLLLIFQAMDAAGKDGTIKHVMSGVNPQGCRVDSFKKPSSEELAHTWLWRYTKQMPGRGMIGIFNRSYYEEVLVVKVHPELLSTPVNNEKEDFWTVRYQDINELEKYLSRNGTVILKFFLNLSKDEQRRRFMERLENSEKHWKFSEFDLVERGHWNEYMNAFEEAINATTTPWAPWYIIPADYKWGMRTIVSQIVTETILSLDLEYPEVSAEKRERLKKTREILLKEED